MKVLLINGPASSGKDTLGSELVLMGCKHRSFRKPVCDMALKFYGIDVDLWNSWYSTEGKELPREELGGLSCRQALIHVSENVVKPVMGKAVWGETVAKTMDEPGSIYVVTDSGFEEEAWAVIDKVGKKNVHLVRLLRAGYTFEGDSRSYIDLGADIPCVNLTLSPTFEGETHYSRTKKIAEDLYRMLSN